MMEKYVISKLKKRIHFLKKIIIHFINMKTEPRLRWPTTAKRKKYDFIHMYYLLFLKVEP